MLLNIIYCEYLEYLGESLYKICESKEIFNNDGTFNRLQIDDQDYNNLSVSEAQKKARENIKVQKGASYKNILTSNKILIDYKTQGEYLYSKYTKSRTNEIKYVKCILSNYFKELFLNAESKVFVNKKKPKHKTDAKFGFYKYGVKFSIIKNAEETCYTCVILVRNDANGKKYLYDILDIKKHELTSIRAVVPRDMT